MPWKALHSMFMYNEIHQVAKTGSVGYNQEIFETELISVWLYSLQQEQNMMIWSKVRSCLSNIVFKK